MTAAGMYTLPMSSTAMVFTVFAVLLFAYVTVAVTVNFPGVDGTPRISSSSPPKYFAASPPGSPFTATDLTAAPLAASGTANEYTSSMPVTGRWKSKGEKSIPAVLTALSSASPMTNFTTCTHLNPPLFFAENVA